MVKDDGVIVELSQREAQLLLQYGYPFDEAKVQLDAFQGCAGPHRLKISDYFLSMMIGDLVRSAKTIRSALVLDELDALCCALESAQQGASRIRAAK